jgi:FkbM family methyltransferase
MMNKLYHFITIRLTKIWVQLYLFVSALIGKQWKKVQGVWLPIKKEIGFDTLRWIVNGEYEIGEINILKAKLAEGDTVLEVGTGLGFISTYCALKLGNDAIVTYEANPVNVALAQQVFKQNKVAPQSHHQILGEKAGWTSFAVNEQQKLASSLMKSGENTIQVEVVALNEVIQHLKPTYLVMDIEGGEYEMLHLIQFGTIQKVQFELHPAILGEEKCQQIFALLAKHHFIQDQTVSVHPNYFFKRQ